MPIHYDMPVQEINSSISSNVFPVDAVMVPHPKYEKAREILAILNDPRFAHLDEIVSIEHNKDGYLITTNSFELQVDVNYLEPANHLIGGHKQFTLVFHDPVKLPNTIQALDPKHRTIQEICTILQDPQFFAKFGYTVTEIRKTETGYVLISQVTEMKVDVEYHKPSNVGDPDCFDLIYSDQVWK